MLPGRDSKIVGAVLGWQGKIVGTNLAVSGTPSTPTIAGTAGNNVGAHNPLEGTTLAAGTYYYFVPTNGCSAVDVTLRTSAGGANITAASTVIYKTMVDGVTEKMNATGSSDAVAASSFTDGTQQTISITDLRGEAGVLLKLVTTDDATFDQAEFSAL